MIDIKKSTVSKTCSLLFLYVEDVLAFSERLGKSQFIYQGLNKSYSMLSNRNLLCCSYGDISIGVILKDLLLNGNVEKAPSQMVIKIDTFPPKIQRTVISSLNECLEKCNISQEILDISPKGHTHTLSIIQLEKEQLQPLLVGIAPVEYAIPALHKFKDTTKDDICRAYHKLAEAFQRYQDYYNCNGWPFHNSAKRKASTTLGVDCGAAPGGWTKYLIEQTACDEVFSIDPGKLADSILSLSNVIHLQMNAQDAIPKLGTLLAERDALISIWVSDMCVHEITKQVDVFLAAKSQGIFQPGAAFVLTIKCNVGHAKERFDELTEKEVNRIKEEGAYDVAVVHLFSNRIGERTVIGYIK
jgi:hypothetical protein